MDSVVAIDLPIATAQDGVAPVLTVVIPIYNEQAGLTEVFRKLSAVTIPHELIVVDDGSSDGTSDLIDQLFHPRMHTYRHAKNLGKGAALKTAFAKVSGEIVIIQDADLEYDPAEYDRLCAPILAGNADVVFGSRLASQSCADMPRITHWANRFITWCFNRCTGQRLTDIETCYKAIRRETLLEILSTLKENRFGIEIELTAKLLKLPGIRFVEVPISYRARSRRDGKKIRFRDGVRALWCILKYR